MSLPHRTAKEQTRDVDAGEDMQKSHSAEQEEERSATHLVDAGLIEGYLSCTTQCRAVRVLIRLRCRDAWTEDLKLPGRLFGAHPVAPPAYDTDEALVRAQVIPIGEYRRHRRWKPQL